MLPPPTNDSFPSSYVFPFISFPSDTASNRPPFVFALPPRFCLHQSPLGFDLVIRSCTSYFWGTMALGNSPCLTPRSRGADDLIERELGCSHWPGLIGRKRVFISNALELPSFNSPPDFSLAKHHNNTSLVGKSCLESLPEDVLVRLLCGVNHEDLKHLVCVSKTIKDAAFVAKQLHFAFNTPSKRRLVGVRSFTNLEGENLCNASVPGGPRRARRLPVEGKKLADISVVLFADLEDA